MSLEIVDLDKKNYYIDFFIKKMTHIKTKFDKYINYIILSYPIFIPYIECSILMENLINESLRKLYLLRYNDRDYINKNRFVIFKKLDENYLVSTKDIIIDIKNIIKMDNKHLSSNAIYERMELFKYSLDLYINGLNELCFSKRIEQIMFIVNRKIMPPCEVLLIFCDYFENYIHNFYF